MYHGFDTDDPDAAVGALLIYAVWRSRDIKRYKVTPDVWGQVERFAKSAAKRATTLPEFVERLKPRLMCSTLSPRYLESDMGSYRPMVETATGEIIEAAGLEGRQFLTRVFADTPPRPVLRMIYRETSLLILLVRERLEREKNTILELEAAEVGE